MNRLPKIFQHGGNHRGHEEDPGSSADFKSSSRTSKRKPRLERRNAKKNIDYECSVPTSGSSSRSSFYSEDYMLSRFELSGGKASFRVDGVDGEVENLCRLLGFSGVEDLCIASEEYEDMKVRSSSSSDKLLRALESLGREVDDIFDDEVVELSVSSDVNEGYENSDIHRNNDVDIHLEDAYRYTDVDNSRFGVKEVNLSLLVERSNEFRGNGINGVRPPILEPPVPLQALGKVYPSVLRSKKGFYTCVNEEGHEDSVVTEIDDREQEGSLERILGNEDSGLRHGYFTSNSIDDDSSSTTTEQTPNFSPDGRSNRVISEWQKGELLGRGSFGSVYEGIADDGFFFAVKEVSLLDHGEEGKQRILQIEQEIALLSRFEHENIVQYYGTKKDESNLYIFLELVTKGSLLSLYRRYTLRDSQVCTYTRQILHGLKYLHCRNVVHRDIKCANILVHADGSVKLADFGLAKLTRTNDVKSCKGTAYWMAPEVVKCEGYGLAADIWGLGCTVLEMLTGRFPYGNMECMAAMFRIGRGELPLIPDSLSSDSRDFILQCLQVDPSRRPTASQLLNHPFVKRPPSSCSPYPFSPAQRKPSVA